MNKPLTHTNTYGDGGAQDFVDDVRSAVMGLYESLKKRDTSTLNKAQVEIMYWFSVFFEEEEGAQK